MQDRNDRKDRRDDDSAWKDILDRLFPRFLEFFFPLIHKDIDWGQGWESLDKELEPILRDAVQGRQIADSLMKVRLRDGSETWILIHVEVQGRPDSGFPLRMFEYNHRIWQRYGKEVVSLAVLADRSPSFRPQGYVQSRWGFRLLLRFPVVKLLDFAGRREELERSSNPFALVVLAVLESWNVMDPATGLGLKFGLARTLYRKRYTREEILSLFRFLDWVIRLPEEQQQEYHQMVKTDLERRPGMPYLAWFERIAIKRGLEKGLEQGRTEGLLEAIGLELKLRFGSKGTALLPRARRIDDPARLRKIVDALARGRDLKEIAALLPRAARRSRATSPSSGS